MHTKLQAHACCNIISTNHPRTPKPPTPVLTHPGLVHCRAGANKQPDHLHAAFLTGGVQWGGTISLPNHTHTQTKRRDAFTSPGTYVHKCTSVFSLPMVTHLGLVDSNTCPDQRPRNLHMPTLSGNEQRSFTISLSSHGDNTRRSARIGTQETTLSITSSPMFIRCVEVHMPSEPCMFLGASVTRRPVDGSNTTHT